LITGLGRHIRAFNGIALMKGGWKLANITDLIELYLKQILQGSSEGSVEIQRSELADKFSCVPSQINYVISTRFTLEKGYYVESKRGGGGYIRIQRVDLPSLEAIQQHIHQSVGFQIDQTTAEGLIYQLEEARFVTKREAHLLKTAVSRDSLTLMLPLRDQIRAKLLKAMLIALLAK
jgi:transcriptional regulator of stress and heat shock response